MPIPSLPTPGSDTDTWGTELNTYLNWVASAPYVTPGWTPGRWYNARSVLDVDYNATSALTANSIYGCPLWVPTGGAAIDRVGLAVQTGAGTLTRLMAHAMLDNGLPGALLFDFGTVGTSTSGDKELTVSATLPGGLIWLTCIPDAAITAGMYDFSRRQLMGSTSQAGDVGTPYRANGSTNAPNPFGTTGISYLSRDFVRLAVRAA